MKFYNPLRPHIAEHDGEYVIRRWIFGWAFLDLEDLPTRNWRRAQDGAGGVPWGYCRTKQARVIMEAMKSIQSKRKPSPYRPIYPRELERQAAIEHLRGDSDSSDETQTNEETLRALIQKIRSQGSSGS